MSTLHIISDPAALDDCLTVAGPDDTLILLGRAVTRAGEGLSRVVFALEEELSDAGQTSELLALIDYMDFVDLVVTHQPIVTWR